MRGLTRLAPAAAFAVVCLCLAPAASAGPSHAFLSDPIGGFGLDKACGTATDSEGDIYVSSAGAGSVEVFSPSGTHLASISDPNQPCGLAVDAQGDVVVNERSTGKVVYFAPDQYPLSAAPSYSAAAPVDESGEAKSVSSDPTDGRLYVAEGDRVDTFANETQEIALANADSGTYKLSFEGQRTSSLPYNATPAEVQAALEALSAIGAHNVSVVAGPTQVSGLDSTSSARVTFTHGLAFTDVPSIGIVPTVTSNAVRKVTVNATAGTYTLTVATVKANVHTTSGSKTVTVTSLRYGEFHVGETVTSFAGLTGATIAAVSGSTIELSKEATATSDGPLEVRQTTAPIPYNAPANEGEGSGSLEAALNALPSVSPGDISVSGGPGGAGGANPYKIVFKGIFAGALMDYASLSANGSGLTGSVSLGIVSYGGGARTAATPAASGGLGIDEVQQVGLFAATGGSFKLVFEGEETAPIAYDAPASEGEGAGSVEAALNALGGVAPGDVSVVLAGSEANPQYVVSFEGTRAASDLAQMEAVSSLSAGSVSVSTLIQGFDGHIGEGELGEATAAAPYTYLYKLAGSPESPSQRYLFAADSSSGEIEVFGGTDIRSLTQREPIDGSATPDGSLGFGSEGAALAVDPLNGHLYSYDAEHEVLDEFEASGRYFTQVSDPSFADAGPTGIAVDRSEGANDGGLYVSAGSSAGAELLAFGPATIPARPPYVAPNRTPRPDLSVALSNSKGVAVDSEGDLYVAAGAAIKVYSPSHVLLTTIAGSNLTRPYSLAVDSEGVLYAIDEGEAVSGDEKIVKLTPSSYPLGSSPSYSEPVTVTAAFIDPKAIAVDPLNDHLVVAPGPGPLLEYDSAAHGSGLLSTTLGQGVLEGIVADIAFGADGKIFLTRGGVGATAVFVLNPTGTKLLTKIDGSGAPGLPEDLFNYARVAVDWSLGDVLVFRAGGSAKIWEFEESGAFVGSYGSFVEVLATPANLAVDNSSGPNAGSAYLAYRDETTAFGPLRYGEPPVVATGAATEIGGGEATLNATVNPRGLEVSDCHFEYLLASTYAEEGASFASAASVPCAQSLGEIGSGSDPVEVDARIAGLDPEAAYRFRISAANQFEATFGPIRGRAGVFGAPALSEEPAKPIGYSEATVKAQIDPTGLATAWRVEYGPTVSYGQSTPPKSLPAADGAVAIKAPLFSLAEGATYHYRVVAENEAGTTAGEDQSFTTLARPEAQSCPNEVLRLEDNSGNLPECRAYELVTPADLRGALPYSGFELNHWQTPPSGPEAGNRLSFTLDATLPGQEGTGLVDTYRMQRAGAGWQLELVSPDYVQSLGSTLRALLASPDQLYFAWVVGKGDERLPGFGPGQLLRTPEGFEALGQGSLGADPKAGVRYIASGGAHVIFSSTAKLEPNAPEAPLQAIYDRSPGGATRVVSLLPGGAVPTSSASFGGASPDGANVVFKLDGALYLRQNNASTVKVANAPATFAGISEDGGRVLYLATGGGGERTGALYAFDVATEAATQIAPDARFANVSADGSHAYFISEEEVGGEGQAGQLNLFAWDGSTRLVAVLDPGDESLETSSEFPISLGDWVSAIEISPFVSGARDSNATRSTPDGSALLFESRAKLTSYENAGRIEVYRYGSATNSLGCVSCDPSGVATTGDARLQFGGQLATASGHTLIPNVTSDGKHVFFESEDQLLPEDSNHVTDVYEWTAQGTGSCKRPGGCLALISTGQSDRPSHLFSMTMDGSDVFFSTEQRILGSDVAGSVSIYDARVNGGFAEEPTPAPCQSDACQGQGSAPPALPNAASAGFSGPGNVPPPAKAKKKHKHKRHARKRHAKHKHKHRRRRHGAKAKRHARAHANRRNAR